MTHPRGVFLHHAIVQSLKVCYFYLQDYMCINLGTGRTQKVCRSNDSECPCFSFLDVTLYLPKRHICHVKQFASRIWGWTLLLSPWVWNTHVYSLSGCGIYTKEVLLWNILHAKVNLARTSSPDIPDSRYHIYLLTFPYPGATYNQWH